MSVVLRLQRLRRRPETEAGRLLRLLFLWRREMSADTIGSSVLWLMKRETITPREPFRSSGRGVHGRRRGAG